MSNDPYADADKSPEQVASFLKQKARGIKRNAEAHCWPIIFEAKQREDAGREAFWTQVVRALLEGTEDPKIDDHSPTDRRLAA
jgi:hypothetical protein